MLDVSVSVFAVTTLPTPNPPTTVTFVVPVGISITSASASFLIVTSFVEPWPVRIRPSAAVYPIAALSPAAVSPSGSKVAAVATPTISTFVVPVGIPSTVASASLTRVTSFVDP